MQIWSARRRRRPQGHVRQRFIRVAARLTILLRNYRLSPTWARYRELMRVLPPRVFRLVRSPAHRRVRY